MRLWLSAWINSSVLPLRVATMLGLAVATVGLMGLAWVFALWLTDRGPARLVCGESLRFTMRACSRPQRRQHLLDVLVAAGDHQHRGMRPQGRQRLRQLLVRVLLAADDQRRGHHLAHRAGLADDRG